MKSVRNWLSDISGNLGELMDMPPMDEPIEELGLTPDEALLLVFGRLRCLPDRSAVRGRPARPCTGDARIRFRHRNR